MRGESEEGGGWRTRRGRDALLCAADTCQCRARVGGGGFEEATKLFGSGEKHVDMNESVSSSSSYLGLASMSRWNQMMGTKRERRERRRKHA